MFALNYLAGFPASLLELAHWSAEIGSDIPFFFSKGSAFCEGRGEIVQNVDLPNASYLICKPGIGLSTPKVLGALDLNKLSQEKPETLLQSFISGKGILLNDLEARGRAAQCTMIDLDSGVQRYDAHRFYLRERFSITKHHFSKALPPE